MSSHRRFKVTSKYRDLEGFHEKPWKTRQYQPAENAYQLLDAEVIYQLLDSADKHHNATGATNRISPRQLLERMSEEPWTCTATVHEGGRGDRSRPADPYLHFNIWFEKNQGKPQHFHVRCRELPQGALLVFQVTY